MSVIQSSKKGKRARTLMHTNHSQLANWALIYERPMTKIAKRMSFEIFWGNNVIDQGKTIL